MLQSSFQTGSNSSLSYCHTVFLTTFLKEAFIATSIYNIIVQCINYILVVRIINNNNNNNNNNAIINNNL